MHKDMLYPPASRSASAAASVATYLQAAARGGLSTLQLDRLRTSAGVLCPWVVPNADLSWAAEMSSMSRSSRRT